MLWVLSDSENVTLDDMDIISLNIRLSHCGVGSFFGYIFFNVMLMPLYIINNTQF